MSDMKHRNEVKLAGALVRDPEIRYTASGKPVCSFTVATTYEKRTEYHRCVAWDEQADRLREKFRKGDYVRLVGRLHTRSWDDRQTGQKKFVTEIIAFQIATEESEPPLTPDLTKSGTGVARAILSPAAKATPNIHGVPITDDDIPF